MYVLFVESCVFLFVLLFRRRNFSQSAWFAIKTNCYCLCCFGPLRSSSSSSLCCCCITTGVIIIFVVVVDEFRGQLACFCYFVHLHARRTLVVITARIQCHQIVVVVEKVETKREFRVCLLLHNDTDLHGSVFDVILCNLQISSSGGGYDRAKKTKLELQNTCVVRKTTEMFVRFVVAKLATRMSEQEKQEICRCMRM